MRRQVAVVTASLILLAAFSRIGGTAAQVRSDQVAHGEYLVKSVAMCVQCHSPRNEAGDLLQDQLLQGARMPFASPYPGTIFAFSAPKLAGIPAGWHEDQIVELLRTGRDFRGRTPRPPMPPFRMNEQDARAVAAYLRSLQ